MKNKILIYPLIFIIKIYQFIFSPLIGNNCRYFPTCSEYANQAIQAIGLFAAIPTIADRLKRCNEPDKDEHESDPFILNHNV